MVLGVLLLGLVMAVAAILETRRARAQIAQALIVGALSESGRVGDEISHRLSTVADLAGQSCAAGWLDPSAEAPEDRERLGRGLALLLGAVPRLHAVHFAEIKSGQSFVVRRLDQGMQFFESDPVRAPGRILVRDFSHDQAFSAPRETDLKYDARTQPWFERAKTLEPPDVVGKATLVEVGTHRFGDGMGYVMSSVMVARLPDGTRVAIAFQLTIKNLVALLEEIPLGATGSLHLVVPGMTESNLSVLRFAEQSDRQLELVPASHVEGPLGSFVASADAKTMETESPRRFSHDGDDWWGQITPVRDLDEEKTWVAAIVSEDDLFSDIADPIVIVLIATLVMLLFVVVRALRVTRVYADPIAALVRQTERMGRLEFTEAETIESKIAEIEVLARSQDRTRRTLAKMMAVDGDLTDQREVLGGSRSGEFKEGRTDVAFATLQGQAVANEVLEVVVDAQGERLLALLSGCQTGLRGAAIGRELRTIVRSASREGASPSDVLTAVGQYLRSSHPDVGGVHAVCLRWREGGAKLEVALCGRIAFVASEHTNISALRDGTEPLGIPDAPSLPLRAVIDLGDGGSLCLFSPALVNALDGARVPLGLERLDEVLSADRLVDPRDSIQMVECAVFAHVNGDGLSRDASVLCMYRGSGANE